MSFTKLETRISNRTLYWQVWHLNRSWGCLISWNHFKLYFKYLFNKKEMRIWLENLIVRLEEDCKCIWNDVFCLSDNRFVMKRSWIDQAESKKFCDIIASCEKYFGLYYAIHMEYKFGHQNCLQYVKFSKISKVWNMKYYICYNEIVAYNLS